MDKKILDDLTAELKKKLDFDLREYEEIDAGMSNKLFRLVSQNEKKLLLKIYWEDVSDPRLEREFNAIKLMQKNGITQIPKAYFYNLDLNYAIYSLEDGSHKKAEELNKEDIKRMVDFLVAIHSIETKNVNPVFKRDSNYTLSSYTERKKHRVNRFLEALKTNALPEYVLHFNEEVNPVALIEEKYEEIKKNAGTFWDQELSENDLRYSPQDFGPHNCLFKNNEIIFLDFEYFCFIDPLFLVAEFIQHDKTYAVQKHLKQLFIDTYKEKMNLSEEKQKRLELLIEINSIQWMSIFLDTTIPKNLAQMHFSIKNFNQEEFIKGQITKFKGRL